MRVAPVIVLAEDIKHWLQKQASSALSPQRLAERVYGLGNPSKARELANTRLGDGYKYRGRGPLQTTGSLNYQRAGNRAGVKESSIRENGFSLEGIGFLSIFPWATGSGLVVELVTRGLNHAAAPRAPVERRSLRATKSMIIGTPSKR